MFRQLKFHFHGNLLNQNVQKQYHGWRKNLRCVVILTAVLLTSDLKLCCFVVIFYFFFSFIEITGSRGDHQIHPGNV